MVTLCDPCTCPDAFYRDEFAFRRAVLMILSDAAGPLADGDCDPGRCPNDWIYDEQTWRKGVILLLCALASVVSTPG